MKITIDQLVKIATIAKKETLEKFLPQLNAALEKYQINTPLRVQHFLAQILHESGCFRWMEEIASGAAYEGRRDLGNIIAGDGKRFKGRGAIQLTGRSNYEKYGKFLKVDLISNPSVVSTTYTLDVAGWFWKEKNLNTLADADNLNSITRKINGGVNGLADRQKYLNLSKKYII